MRAERVRREIVATCREPLGAPELLRAISALVDEAVPSDATCWSTFDPATTMVTAAIGRDLDETGDAAIRFFELEYGLDTAGQYRRLTTSDSPVAVLDTAAPPTDDDTAALRGHLDQLGVRQELRVLFREQGEGWGGAGLMRATEPFTDEERAFLELVASTVAGGVRAALVRGTPTPAADAPPEGPAVLVLDRAGVVEATPAAARWVEQLHRVDVDHGDLPAVVQAVGTSASSGHTIAQRARTANGSWVVLRGAPLGAGRAVVTIEPAGPPEVTSLLTSALGLTGREQDVVVGVLRGLSTKEIASVLHMSPYTVQDHLKVVFAKAGVNSRRELVSDVFFGVYFPRLGSAVRPDGFFAAELR